MRSRWADNTEQRELQALWLLCFEEDSKADAASFFANFPPQRHTRVIAADGKLAAMASWMPVTLCGRSAQCAGAYLYAVATHPAARGRGLCRALLAELEAVLWAQSISFTALCPIAASLYGFYGSMGYEPAFAPKASAPVAAAGTLVEITPAAYRQLRERWLTPPYCRWDAPAYAYLAGTDVRFYRTGAGGCVAIELLDDGGTRVLEQLGCHLAASEAPQGMIKWHTAPWDVREANLGFAFD